VSHATPSLDVVSVIIGWMCDGYITYSSTITLFTFRFANSYRTYSDSFDANGGTNSFTNDNANG
jgi:nicotinamide riboside transporter PnuC